MLLGGARAFAQQSPLTLKVATSLTFDNNLFRLPAGTDTVQRLGKDSAAEQINTTSVGLIFSTRLGLQQVDVTASMANNRYQNFDYLNSTTYNYNANLKWSMTPQLHGTVTLDRAETLNSFSDYSGINQRNQRTETTHRVNAVYELDGQWQLLAGASQLTQTNQQELLAGGDYSTNTFETGVSRLLASGSSLTINHQATQGQYSLRSNGDFEQRNTALRLHWVLMNRNTAELSMSQISRSHPNNARRDFSGLNFSTSLNWLLTGQSSLTLGQERSFAAYASSFSDFTQTDKLYLTPSWQISAKTLLRLRHDWAKIQYLGETSSQLPSQRKDITRDTGLSLFWQPDERLTFSTVLQSARRRSSQTGLDYGSSQISFSAQYRY